MGIDKKKGCQLEVLYDDTIKMSFKDILRHFALRLLSAIERRIRKIHMRLSSPQLSKIILGIQESGNNNEASKNVPAGLGKEEFEPGEIVEVLSMEEISKTLTPDGKSEGLDFMDGMKEFCGKNLRVKKKVALLFDERRQKMVRVRRQRYILENAICEGKDAYDREGCDRSCFFFWSPKWLRKQEEVDPNVKTVFPRI